MANYKPIHLALLTAVISGISVFLNGILVKGVDPFIFTTVKNIAVVLLLISLILLFKERKELLSLNKIQLSKLAIIGAIGGSVPFLLFFWGLSISSGAIGSFVYRLLFLFASATAFLFLKEKISKNFLIGGVIVLFGNMLLLKGALVFGFGELLVLLATILWAIEFNISKVVLEEISPRVVSFGRMFFGSIILLAFLAFTGKIGSISSMPLESLVITSVFLFAYLLAWYPALKSLPISVSTPVLALGGPISAILALILTGKALLPIEIAGTFLVLLGIVVMANLHSKKSLYLETIKA